MRRRRREKIRSAAASDEKIRSAASDEAFVYELRLAEDGTGAGVELATREAGPGLRVARVKPHGAAWKCGIRTRDLLISINGIPCSVRASQTAHTTPTRNNPPPPPAR